MEKSALDYNRLAGQLFNVSDFPQCNGKKGAQYLDWVSHIVSTHKNKRFPLNSPKDAILTVTPLEDTIYRDEHYQVNGWGKFYLPDIVTMQVIGVVEGTTCPCDQLVLMTCEDRRMYAYDGEELHVVASNLEQLRLEGIEYPASKTYFKGEAFKDMTKEDWAKVKQGPVGRRLAEQQRQLLLSKKSELLKNLRISKQNAGLAR